MDGCEPMMCFGWRSDPGWDPALQLWNARTGSKIDFFDLQKPENMFDQSASRPNWPCGRQSSGSYVRIKHEVQEKVLGLLSPAEIMSGLVLIRNGPGLPAVGVSSAEHTHSFPPASATCVANSGPCFPTLSSLRTRSSADMQPRK